MSASGGVDDLTGEEMAVLALMAEDQSNREISESLGVGEACVRRLVSSLLAKLGFRSGIPVADQPRTTSPAPNSAADRPAEY